ncbi:MAG: hypothetical protein AAF984_06870, partial [Verrucomicrobiota bacterium]
AGLAYTGGTITKSYDGTDEVVQSLSNNDFSFSFDGSTANGFSPVTMTNITGTYQDVNANGIPGEADPFPLINVDFDFDTFSFDNTQFSVNGSVATVIGLGGITETFTELNDQAVGRINAAFFDDLETEQDESMANIFDQQLSLNPSINYYFLPPVAEGVEGNEDENKYIIYLSSGDLE